MGDIWDKILKFYIHLEGDDNHRYKSWEHCYLKALDIEPEVFTTP